MSTHQKQKRIVISIESRKGGTGKTLAALMLAKRLKDEGYCTLVIDADVTGTALTNAIGSNLYPTDVFHPIHEEEFEENQRDEEKYADFFSDFNRYLKTHRYPEFRIDKKNDELFHVNLERVNVYGSEFSRDKDLKWKSDKKTSSESESKNREGVSSIIFNDLYSRWLLRFIKHVCTQFAQTVSSKKNVAIIIDNSPGSAGIIPYLREWLTDMGPEHGKFLFVTTLDERDMKACRIEIRRVIESYRKKRDLAWNYQNGEVESNEDKGFLARLNECDFFQETKHPDPEDGPCVPLHSTAPFLDATQLYYLSRHFLKEEECRRNQPEKQGPQFITILINKVPADLFAGNTLTSHDRKTLDFVDQFLEEVGIKQNDKEQHKDEEDPVKYVKRYIAFREPLLAYAHLHSNTKPGGIQLKDSECETKYERYDFLQIQAARLLCPLLQDNLSDVIDYFFAGPFTGDCEKYEKNEREIPENFLFHVDLLNVTMNRLRAILYPFAHDDLNVIFPSLGGEKHGDHLTPAGALLVKTDQFIENVEQFIETTKPADQDHESAEINPEQRRKIMKKGQKDQTPPEGRWVAPKNVFMCRKRIDLEYVNEQMASKGGDVSLTDIGMLFRYLYRRREKRYLPLLLLPYAYFHFLPKPDTGSLQQLDDLLFFEEKIQEKLAEKNWPEKMVARDFYQELWEQRARLLEKGEKLQKEGEKLLDEGKKLQKEGKKLQKEGEELQKEGKRLLEKGEKLQKEGEKLLENAFLIRFLEFNIRFYDLVADTALILAAISHYCKSGDQAKSQQAVEEVIGIRETKNRDSFNIKEKEKRACEIFSHSEFCFDDVKINVLEKFERSVGEVLKRLSLEKQPQSS